MTIITLVLMMIDTAIYKFCGIIAFYLYMICIIHASDLINMLITGGNRNHYIKASCLSLFVIWIYFIIYTSTTFDTPSDNEIAAVILMILILTIHTFYYIIFIGINELSNNKYRPTIKEMIFKIISFLSELVIFTILYAAL